MVVAEGIESKALAEVTYAILEPPISFKTFPCSALEDKMECCTSSQGFFKSIWLCDPDFRVAKSLQILGSPHAEN